MGSEEKQAQAKTKLKDQLAAKRAKKEKELKEREEQAMIELKKKQESEMKEREALRLAKMAWSEKVKEVMETSKKFGLSPAESENYCFKETLGKGLIPEKQLNEGVRLILK